MRSPRNFAASALFLLAIPLAVLLQALSGFEAEIFLHFELALAAALLCPADLNTPRWIKILGRVASGLLFLTFALQVIAQTTGIEFFNWLGFQILGQLPESIFIDLLFIWLIGVFLTDSTGKSRIFGAVCLFLAVGLKIYSYILAILGTTLDEKYPALKMLLLMPFLWLMLESKKRPLARDV